MAQGRAHRRTSAPGSYTLGVDVIGPYHKSPDETSLQRRYALVATYLLPVTQEGKPLLTEAHEQGTEEAELEMVELDKEVREWFEELSTGAEAGGLPRSRRRVIFCTAVVKRGWQLRVAAVVNTVFMALTLQRIQETFALSLTWMLVLSVDEEAWAFKLD